MRVETIAIRVEAIAIRVEGIAIGGHRYYGRGIAIRVETSLLGWRPSLLGWRPRY